MIFSLGQATPALASEADEFASYLNEFSDLRRVNTIFPNHQASTHGVQVDYVNVGTGNLTFARRDLVVVGPQPMILERIYDSSYVADGGLSSGWRFSIAETVAIDDGGQLTLTDHTLSRISFRRTDAGDYVPASGVAEGIERIIDNGDTLQLELQDGWTKTFSPVGSVYRLINIQAPQGGEVTLNYEGQSLSRVSNGFQSIEISNDSRGRPVEARGPDGRSVAVDLHGNLTRDLH